MSDMADARAWLAEHIDPAEPPAHVVVEGASAPSAAVDHRVQCAKCGTFFILGERHACAQRYASQPLYWSCGHLLSAHTRAEAAECLRRREAEAAITKVAAATGVDAPPTSADAITMHLWNGYLAAIAQSRGPRLLLSARDIAAMLKLRDIATGAVS